MSKQRINLTLDTDVLAFIDELARAARMQRSEYVNRHFLGMLPEAARALQPAPKRKAITKPKPRRR